MISVKDLKFTYPKSEKEVINSINFDIREGEIFGFLGPSGAGKTTTQRLIIGLLRGYKGQIVVLGKERNQWGKEFYENIGVAFDFPNLYIKLTAEENLKLIQSYYKNQSKSIDTLLDQVGLLSDKQKVVESFSKGMKMRLNFVRSIMHEPTLMFFDEPTSGLDPVNAKIIKDIILDLKKQGKTIFLTTHNMTVAEQLCDRVAFIVDGSIPVVDTPKNLMIAHGKSKVKVEYIQNGQLLESQFDLKTINQNQHFIEIIKNYEIRTIHTQEATLENVFIKLTGRALL